MFAKRFADTWKPTRDHKYERRSEARTTVCPTLKGKKVIIRLVSGGRPVTRTIEGYKTDI
jgi:hypothetical protein